MNSPVLNGIMGLCVADALGVPVEFKSRSSLQAHPVKDMRAYGTYSQPAGTWSDDTSLTLCLAESLASRGEVDYQDIMNNFSAWLNEGHFTPHGKVFDVGRTSSQAIRRFDDGFDPRLSGSTHENENGNGSLMRILPLAFYLREVYGPDFMAHEEARDIIHQVSALTHAHPRSMAACGIYLAVAGRLLAGFKPEAAVRSGLDQARTLYEHHLEFAAEWASFARLAAPSFAGLPESDIRSGGYVIDTLEAAVWCLLNTQDYRTCVLKAVNLGEDTDTVAAVAGGLAGLAYGIGALPAEWLHAIARRDFVEETCQRLTLALERIAIRKLCRFLPYFEHATRETVCPVGFEVAAEPGPGTGEDVYALPFPQYSETLNEFVRDFTQSSLFDRDYLDLTAPLSFENMREVAELVDTADLPLARALLSGFVDQEQFCEGMWGHAVDTKLFYRLLQRIAELAGVSDCLPQPV